MNNKIAIVTGSNKGIGYAIVRELCEREVSVVYLTARDVDRGENAVAKLKKKGFNPVFHQLDVTDKESVKRFADYIKKTHGGFDILINNAGLASTSLCTRLDDAKKVIDANFHGVITVQQFFFPLLRENGRVINVSSDCGHISNLRNKHWIKVLTSEELKLHDIYKFVDWFLDSVANGTLKWKDFYQVSILPYRISKIALSALTRVQQKEINRNISINSLHPGFIKTDMTLGVGYLALAEAGKTPAYLALDAPQSLKGAYVWFDGKEVDWTDANSDHHFNCYASFVGAYFEALFSKRFILMILFVCLISIYIKFCYF